MKTNLKIILQIFSILLGLFYCSFIIWNRLFRTRQLRDLILDVNPSIITIYSILFVVTLILLLYNIKLALQIKTNSKIYIYIEKKPYILNTLSFLVQYIINAPKNLYEFLYKYINIWYYIDVICYFVVNEQLYGKQGWKKFTIYFINILKLFVVLVFIYDVIYVGKFIHFFKFLPLLIIPLVFEVLLFIIFHSASDGSRTIGKWFEIEANEEDTGYIFTLREEFQNDPYFTDEIMRYHADNWQAYINAMMAIDLYYGLEKKIKPFFNIIIYTIYTIGWCYLLFNIWIL
jgi:hypothetical protein